MVTGVHISRVLCILPSRGKGIERKRQPRDFDDKADLLRSMVRKLEPQYLQLTTDHPGMTRLDKATAFDDGEV